MKLEHKMVRSIREWQKDLDVLGLSVTVGTFTIKTFPFAPCARCRMDPLSMILRAVTLGHLWAAFRTVNIVAMIEDHLLQT